MKYSRQQTLIPQTEPENYRDVVLTPEHIAKDIIDRFQPSGKCLDPCKGDGAFLKYLPANSDWCEIREGKDFFDYFKKVDWIVSNPPYSMFAVWLRHSFKIADHIVYLIPVDKPFISYNFMLDTRVFGGIKEIYTIGTGAMCNFPCGFAVGAVYFKRNYKGDIKITFKA